MIIKRPEFEFFQFSVAGVTFETDGKSRQAALRRMKFEDPPFYGDLKVHLEEYECEGNPAVGVYINNFQIGNVPWKAVRKVLKWMESGATVSAIEITGGGRSELDKGENQNYGFDITLRRPAPEPDPNLCAICQKYPIAQADLCEGCIKEIRDDARAKVDKFKEIIANRNITSSRAVDLLFEVEDAYSELCEYREHGYLYNAKTDIDKLYNNVVTKLGKVKDGKSKSFATAINIALIILGAAFVIYFLIRMLPSF